MTANQLINAILQEIYLQADEQQIQSVDYQAAQLYTNLMMFELDAEGIKLGWTELKNPADNVTVPAGALLGITTNAALRLANSYDIQVGPLLAVNAEKGLRAMRKLGVSIQNMNYPSTLPIGSGNEWDAIGNDHFYPGCCEDIDECLDE